MSLLNAKNFHPDIDVNGGVFQVPQIELIGQASAPTGADLADGRIYYSTADNTIYARINGDWVAWETAVENSHANALTQTGTLEADENDLTWSIASQSSAGTVGIRDLNLADETDYFVFEAANQTLSNKTLTAPIIKTADGIFDDGGDAYIIFTEATTPKTYISIASGDTGVAPQVRGAGETNTNLLLAGTGTGNVTIGDGADITKLVSFELSGATTGKIMTFVCSHNDNRTITFPNATDTLVGKATTDTFTNKSFDCNGTGNSLTNVNATELEPITFGTDEFGVTFIMGKDVSNSADTTIVASTSYKIRILDVWVVSTANGNSGTWKLTDGTNDITDAKNWGTGDKDVVHADKIDDAYIELPANSALHCINSVNTDDGIMYVLAVRVD